MKKLILTTLMALTVAIMTANGTEQNIRLDSLFNFGWRFHYGDLSGAEAPSYNDMAWRTLDLPHDFQIEQPWKRSAGAGRGYKEMGTGWYRKTFRPSQKWRGQRVLLDFGGIIYYGDVWLNGVKVASTDYGYVGLEADLTGLLKYDEDNIVAVRACTGKFGGSRWYTGGGLFRDVRLIVKDSLSVARHGLYVTTPIVSTDKATVQIQVEMDGAESERSCGVELKARIYSPEGSLVGESTAQVPRSKLRHVEIKLPLVEIVKPSLWSCENPSLYRVEVSVLRNGVETDRVSDEFGVRKVEFSPEFGLRLNGKKVFLKGVAIHHDLGALGAAAFDSGVERLFKRLKQFGFNHIRTSHNPYSEGFMRLADRMGILVVDELIDKWSDDSYWGGRQPFTSLWHKLIPEWIKRDRNRASVIMWSLGNELQMREDLAGFDTGDWGITTYKIFDTMVKRYDSSRKTTVAMYPSRAGAITKKDSGFKTELVPPELATVTEVSSFNYEWPAYKEYLRHAPHMTLYQSEAATYELTAPYFGMDYDRMVGLAYWGAVEYWGESSGWPKKGWNYSVFSHTLEPKPQAYLMKSAFDSTPLVHIGVVVGNDESLVWNDVQVGRANLSSRWNFPEGSTQNVLTFTNADEVELFVNGKSIGVKSNDRTNPNKRNIIKWDNVSYGKGGSIVAVALNKGSEVARHAVETAGKAVSLQVETENKDWKADGMSLQYIRVYAVDSKNRRMELASNNVKFTVTGEASLLAVDNGDHYTDSVFTHDSCQMLDGFAMAILRSTMRAGRVNVKITADGLKPVTFKLVTGR